MNSKSMQFKAGTIITVGMILATFSYYAYQIFFTANLQVDKKETYLYVPTGASFETLTDSLNKNEILNDKISFYFLSKLIGYREKIKPGKYLIKSNMGNLEALKMLKRGKQTPVKLTFNNIRLKKDLAEKIAQKLEIKFEQLDSVLHNPEYAQKYGYRSETFGCMFIPNTYEMYWNISLEDFFNRMKTEHDKFWNKTRREKAESMAYSIEQITILASIVEAETNKNDEKSRVAGVYLNRLKINMPLQADPTVKFAVGDFSIKRIYSGHIAKDSPYNTYKYSGLPPGPINIPSINSIDAVLNYEKHNYLYFCAHHDLSGHHDFATTYEEHLKIAEKYRKALNKLNIK
ncbi:MAG: endolytic transglycosylase MltG [Cytophagales bacterium]|nr:MAG: endolytic transglycosylase MltG [Cytophagales bacterium]